MRTTKKAPAPKSAAPGIESLYPYVAAWVQDGSIEIGESYYSPGFVRAFDEGGLVFEGKPASRYKNLDAALRDLNEGIKSWCKEWGIDLGIEDE